MPSYGGTTCEATADSDLVSERTSNVAGSLDRPVTMTAWGQRCPNDAPLMRRCMGRQFGCDCRRCHDVAEWSAQQSVSAVADQQEIHQRSMRLSVSLLSHLNDSPMPEVMKSRVTSDRVRKALDVGDYGLAKLRAGETERTIATATRRRHGAVRTG